MFVVSRCPVCDSNDFESLFACKDFTVSHETFSLIKCTSCSLIATSPRPDEEELGRYYFSDNYISHKKKATSFLDNIYRIARLIMLNRKLSLIKRWSGINLSSILDYGCGTGDFLKKCKDAGLKITGVEPSQTAREIASHNTGVDIKTTINDITHPADVITLWHVLEHVHDPDNLLLKLHSMLSENGTMFIAVPNHESYDAQKYKQHWAGYDVPRHLWHFKKDNIDQLLTKNHFKLIGVLPMKLDAFYVSILSEKYQGHNGATSLVKGLFTGITSNLRARNDNYSSLIYVARK